MPNYSEGAFQVKGMRKAKAKTTEAKLGPHILLGVPS